jgi:hypothetical protein
VVGNHRDGGAKQYPVFVNPLGLATETEKTRMNFVLQQSWPESEEEIEKKIFTFLCYSHRRVDS